MKNLTRMLTCLIVLALGIGQSAGQYKWTKDLNPVFSGVPGTWSAHVFCPCVIFNSDSARYEMWFNACPGPNSDPTWRPYSVGRAVSKDGLHWVMDPSPVLSPDPGKWDASTIDAPEVIREKTQSAVVYKMWYASWANSSSPDYLGYATSPDGIHWTKYSGNPIFGPGSAAWEAGGPWGVSILPYQGGYRMWYSAYIAGFTVTSLGYATSADGLNWKRDTLHDPVLVGGATFQWDDGGPWMPNVIAIGDSLYLFYVGDHTGGNGQTGVAVSLDGVTWAKCGANPVLVPGGYGTWDNDRSCVGAILLAGDTLHMWYDGWKTPYTVYQYSIGHAWSVILLNLLTPADRVPQHADTVKFTWHRSLIPATKYWFEQSPDSLFTDKIVDSTLVDTTKVLRQLTHNQKIWWRVRAKYASGWGSYSTSRSLDVVTSIEEPNGLPVTYSLSQNYPNPFNPVTTIRYGLPHQSDVTLAVYNPLGQMVTMLVQESQEAGYHELKFDGRSLASGVYFYRLQAGEFIEVKKLLLLR